MDGAKQYIGGVVRNKKEFEDILIGGTINCIWFVSVVKNDLVNGIKSHHLNCIKSRHAYMMLFMSLDTIISIPKNLLLKSKQFLYKTSLYSNNPLLSSKN